MVTNDVDKDFILISVPGMLAFSKRRSHREEMLQFHTTMCHFLQDNGLLTTQIVSSDEQVPDTLEVKRALFTDEGYEFFRTGIQKWVAATDRGTPLTDTSILERELKKLRKETSKS